MLAEKQKEAYLDGWGTKDIERLAKHIYATEGIHYPTIIIETAKKELVILVEDYAREKTFAAAKQSLAEALRENNGLVGSIIFLNETKLYRYRYIGWYRLEAL